MSNFIFQNESQLEILVFFLRYRTYSFKLEKGKEYRLFQYFLKGPRYVLKFKSNAIHLTVLVLI